MVSVCRDRCEASAGRGFDEVLEDVRHDAYLDDEQWLDEVVSVAAEVRRTTR